MDEAFKRRMHHRRGCPVREDAEAVCDCERLGREHRYELSLTDEPLTDEQLTEIDEAAWSYNRCPGLWALMGRAEQGPDYRYPNAEELREADIAKVDLIKSVIGADAYEVLKAANPFTLRALVGECRRYREHTKERHHDGADVPDIDAADQSASQAEAKARLQEALFFGGDENVWPSGMDYRMAAARLIAKQREEIQRLRGTPEAYEADLQARDELKRVLGIGGACEGTDYRVIAARLIERLRGRTIPYDDVRDEIAQSIADAEADLRHADADGGAIGASGAAAAVKALRELQHVLLKSNWPTEHGRIYEADYEEPEGGE